MTGTILVILHKNNFPSLCLALSLSHNPFLLYAVLMTSWTRQEAVWPLIKHSGD